MVKIVDLFAGPGGLSEGFSSLNDENGDRKFDVSLSIEMDKFAHQTLLLSSFFRQFKEDLVPDK
jgi:DNA (cytosine-5)-methyltransferase 1